MACHGVWNLYVHVYVHPSVEPKEVHVHEYQQVEVGFLLTAIRKRLLEYCLGTLSVDKLNIFLAHICMVNGKILT